MPPGLVLAVAFHEGQRFRYNGRTRQPSNHR